jgi:hypothetical protein
MSSVKDLKLRLWYLMKKYLYQKHPVCQACNRAETVDQHHIVLKSRCHYLEFDERNLMSVCRVCHSKLHPTGRKRHVFDGLEVADMLIRVKGLKTLDYLTANRHQKKHWYAYELQDMITEYRQKLKEI